LCVVVEGQDAGALLVGQLEGVAAAGAGADDFTATWQRDEPGAGDGLAAAGAGQDDLFGAAEQVQGGFGGVFLEQDVAVGVVDVAGGAGYPKGAAPLTSLQRQTHARKIKVGSSQPREQCQHQQPASELESHR
jgi:hypothetical protein